MKKKQSQALRQIRRRPDLRTQLPEVRDRCMKLGQVFNELEQKKRENRGILPHGSRPAAIAQLRELGIILSPDRFEELWERQYLPYRAAFPDSSPEEAFSPHPVGRPKGRDVPPEVTDLIYKLYKEPSFQSANYDGSLNDKSRPVAAKAILHGVWNVYPQYKDLVKLYDIYAALHDVQRYDRASILAGRGEYKEFDDNLPSRNSDIEGVDEQWQLDIRSFPSYVRWGDIMCTTKGVIISDRISSEILIGEAIPGKRSDDDEEVWSGEYTAQMIRELIAIAIRRHRRRPRTFYADNGPQFKAKTLEPYMHYLVSEGQAATEWVNRKVKVARGGGFIEDVLGDVDRYLQKFAGTYKEDKEKFWNVYERIKKDQKVLPTFKTFAEDFQSHIIYLNTSREDSPDGLSRVDRRHNGPDFSLSMPPDLNLAVFARAVEHKLVKVQHYGIDYAKKKWEPERDTPQIRQAWHKATLSTIKRPLLIVKIGQEILVFIDFEGKGCDWEPLIVKGKPRNTKKEDRQLNDEAKRLTLQKNKADSAELDKLLRDTIGRPLVISPDGTKLIPMPEPSDLLSTNEIVLENRTDNGESTTVGQSISNISNQADPEHLQQLSLEDLEQVEDKKSIDVIVSSSEDLVLEKGSENHSTSRRETTSKGRSKNSRTSQNSDRISTSSHDQKTSPALTDVNEDDFWSNF